MIREEDVITRTLVADDDRLDFLPKHLGLSNLWTGQNLFPVYLEKLSADYKGGYWEFYELSNGGWYMAPRGEQRYQMHWDGNYYEGNMSADAAGITASLFTLSHLANTTQQDPLIEAYHWLREYATQHAEWEQIGRAID
jgi:hypothetical protein